MAAQTLMLQVNRVVSLCCPDALWILTCRPRFVGAECNIARVTVPDVHTGSAQQASASNQAAPRGGQAAESVGFKVVQPSGGLPLKTDGAGRSGGGDMGVEGDDGEGSGWETVSELDEEEGDEQQEDWVDWDLCRSLFDNHVSR